MKKCGNSATMKNCSPNLLDIFQTSVYSDSIAKEINGVDFMIRRETTMKNFGMFCFIVLFVLTLTCEGNGGEELHIDVDDPIFSRAYPELLWTI